MSHNAFQGAQPDSTIKKPFSFQLLLCETTFVTERKDTFTCFPTLAFNKRLFSGFTKSAWLNKLKVALLVIWWSIEFKQSRW